MAHGEVDLDGKDDCFHDPVEWEHCWEKCQYLTLVKIYEDEDFAHLCEEHGDISLIDYVQQINLIVLHFKCKYLQIR